MLDFGEGRKGNLGGASAERLQKVRFKRITFK